MAAMISLRNLEPIELALPSGQTIRFQIPFDHEFLWDDFLSASPATLVNRYLAHSTQPTVAVAELSPQDLAHIFITALVCETRQHRLSAHLSTDALCTEFLEALLGISQHEYAERRPQLFVALHAFCEERIARIDQLIGKNQVEHQKIRTLTIHHCAAKVRLERLSSNIRLLKLKKHTLEEELQKPDRTIGSLAIRGVSDPQTPMSNLDTIIAKIRAFRDARD